MKYEARFVACFLYIFSFINCYDAISKWKSELPICETDDFVSIDINKQDLYLLKAKVDCDNAMKKSLNESDACWTTWDSITCWSETKVNQTVYLPCPNYVNRFNKKNQVIKHCEFDVNTSKPVWSKSNYSSCLSKVTVCNYTSVLQNHMKAIITIRIIGYAASMVSLTLSIIILLRPKLKCPRNFMHINLFVAFAVRTIMVMVVDSVISIHKSSSTNSFIKLNNPDKILQKYVPCKIVMSFFRYSGSVYHVAITSEALYLVLLLKFPYYSEKKGCKFCIITSWVLPIVWIIPWILVRALVDNFWCWQAESNLNLILKVPHSLLLICNISCAVFIIRILYSKMRNRNFSREKLLKYRRLAKSVLILIPIFGLHFIFFAWLPYASLINLNISDGFEIVVVYIEIIFNAFQGFVVSITSCFIHAEVRIEFILYFCELLKKIKCLKFIPCILNCLESDYVRQLRYVYHENNRNLTKINHMGTYNNGIAAAAAVTNSNKHRPFNIPKVSMSNKCSIDEEENVMIPKVTYSKSSKLSKASNNYDQVSNRRKSSLSASLVSYQNNSKCWSFLFGNQQNDFFSDSRSQTNRRRRSNNLLKKLSFSRNNKSNSRQPSEISNINILKDLNKEDNLSPEKRVKLLVGSNYLNQTNKSNDTLSNISSNVSNQSDTNNIKKLDQSESNLKSNNNNKNPNIIYEQKKKSQINNDKKSAEVDEDLNSNELTVTIDDNLKVICLNCGKQKTVLSNLSNHIETCKCDEFVSNDKSQVINNQNK